jgi:hypothetical protein
MIFLIKETHKKKYYESYIQAIIEPEIYNVYDEKLFYEKIEKCNSNMDIYKLLIEYTKIAHEKVKSGKVFSEIYYNITDLIIALKNSEFKYKSILIKYAFLDSNNVNELNKNLSNIRF